MRLENIITVRHPELLINSSFIVTALLSTTQINPSFTKQELLNAPFAAAIMFSGNNFCNGDPCPSNHSSPYNVMGNLILGNTSAGSLTIAGGGVVINEIGIVGNKVGGNGTVTVNGTGSRWDNSKQLTVGFLGTGMLNIQNGGVVSNLDIGYIGNNTGSNGTVTVNGTGSRWNNQQLMVGNKGTGMLSIQNGGVVSSRGDL